MGRYRKVTAGTWGDKRVRALSERAKLLWFYLLTGPEVTNLPGLLLLGRAQLCESFGWEPAVLDAVFAELGPVKDDGPMAVADWQARVVWLPNAWRHNSPDNPNQVVGWRDQWRMVPECDLKDQAAETLRAALSQMGAPYLSALSRVLGTVPSTVDQTVHATVGLTSLKPSLARARAAPAPAPVPAPVSGGVQGGLTDDPSPVTLEEPFSDAAGRLVETVAMNTGWRPPDVGEEWLKYIGKVAVSRSRSQLLGGWQKWLVDGKRYAANESVRRPAKPKQASAGGFTYDDSHIPEKP